VADDVVAGGRLLPRVGDDDPGGGEDRPQEHHHGRQEVDPRPDPVPAEDEHRQEPRLEEEGEDALGGERRAEHVAHEPRVGGPVRPELELHDDAGRDADREVPREHAGPEAGRPLPRLLAGDEVGALEHHHERPQPDGQ